MAGSKKSDKTGTQVLNGKHREKHPNNLPSNQVTQKPKTNNTDKADCDIQQNPLHNFYKTLLGIVVILFILSFISGQKWNEMKRASYYTSKRQLIAQETTEFYSPADNRNNVCFHAYCIFIVF